MNVLANAFTHYMLSSCCIRWYYFQLFFQPSRVDMHLARACQCVCLHVCMIEDQFCVALRFHWGWRGAVFGCLYWGRYFATFARVLCCDPRPLQHEDMCAHSSVCEHLVKMICLVASERGLSFLEVIGCGFLTGPGGRPAREVHTSTSLESTKRTAALGPALGCCRCRSWY